MMLTQEKLKQRFHYNPITGVFTRKTSAGGNTKGTVAGAKSSGGYLWLKIDRKAYQAHRLAWFYMNGEWPNQVDHINRVRGDNSWDNLRNVDHSINQRNKTVQGNSKSRITGVNWHSGLKQWRANIYTDNGRTHLGWFKCLFEAACARKSAENKYGYL